MADVQAESRLFIKSVEKSLQVLCAFEGQNQCLSEMQIAKAVGMHRSSVQRIVYTLERLGYLQRNPERQGYALTQKVLRLSYNYLRANSTVIQAWPHIVDLNRTLRETINLHELDDTDVVFIARLRRRNIEHIDLVVGSRLPAFCTASGTAILAHLPVERCKALLQSSTLDRRTPFTEIDPDKLWHRIDQTRRNGYIVLANESVVGDISIGAPILDREGIAIAGLSISVSSRLWTIERVEAELVEPIRSASSAISMALGGSGIRGLG